jgi:hypothetical protein
MSDGCNRPKVWNTRGDKGEEMPCGTDIKAKCIALTTYLEEHVSKLSGNRFENVLYIIPLFQIALMREDAHFRNSSELCIMILLNMLQIHPVVLSKLAVSEIAYPL